MINAMHNVMFAVAPFLVPFAVVTFLGSFFISACVREERIFIYGMLLDIALFAFCAVYVLVYWLIGGMAMYPNG
jgi:hypothetical protein